MDILDTWIEDLPQQFQGKPYIEALISVFSRQIEELHQVFKQLDTKTDLESAVGKNLDMIGDIVALTRKEAGILAGIDATEPVITDERYRKFLRYKILKNTNNCTYYDMMQSFELLWKTDNIKYYEDPKRPATILIIFQTFDVDSENDPADGKVLVIKPAGVALIYTFNYVVIVDSSVLEQFYLSHMSFYFKVPFWGLELHYSGRIRYDGSKKYTVKRQYNLGVDLYLHSVVEELKESIGNLTVKTCRNVQYYNGAKKYNGETKYNALIKEDVIE